MPCCGIICFAHPTVNQLALTSTFCRPEHSRGKLLACMNCVRALATSNS